MPGSALRELVATFRIGYDGRGARQGNEALNKLQMTSRRAADAVAQASAKVVAQEIRVAQAVDATSRKKEMALLRELRAKEKAAKLSHRAAMSELRDLRATTRAEERKARAAEKSAAVQAQARGASGAGIFGGLAAFFGIDLAIRGFGGIVKAASDVEETLNVLEVAFGNNQQQVIDFARTAAREVGRSEFMLREFAGTIGAVVTPSLKDLGDEAFAKSAEIGQNFAKLAVDLSSLFNTTEEDALIALRAGVIGEAEPLRRFGVNLVEQNLADSLGIKPSDLQKMSQTEKLLTRYNFIMEQTTGAQGDAARTAEGFANLIRNAGGQVRNLAAVIGNRMLPPINKLLMSLTGVGSGTAGTLDRFSDLIKTSSVLETVLGGIAAALTALLLRLVVLNIPTLLTIAAFVGLALVAEDVITAFRGGKSVFGDWLDGLTGVEGSAMILSQTLGDLGLAIAQLFTGGGPELDKFVQAWRNGMADIIDSIVGVLKPAQTLLRILQGVLPGGVVLNALGEDPVSLLESAAEGLRTDQTSGQRGTGAVSPRSLAFQSRGGAVSGGTPQVLRAPAPLAFPAFDMRALNPPGPSSNTTNFNESKYRQDITVNVNAGGGTGAQDIGRETERGVRRALRDERRKVATAVGN